MTRPKRTDIDATLSGLREDTERAGTDTADRLARDEPWHPRLHRVCPRRAPPATASTETTLS